MRSLCCHTAKRTGVNEMPVDIVHGEQIELMQVLPPDLDHNLRAEERGSDSRVPPQMRR